MHDDDPATLVRRIRDGDSHAEAELIVRFRAGLALVLRRRVKDAARAEDLCQEVFRIALAALRDGRLEDGSKLTAYLWGIARNVASTDRRLDRRSRHDVVSEALPDMRPTPDQQLMNAERARMIRQAVTDLSARDRTVLTAYYLADTSKETICRRLGLTGAQFDVIKWRALKRLLVALRLREACDE